LRSFRYQANTSTFICSHFILMEETSSMRTNICPKYSSCLLVATATSEVKLPPFYWNHRRILVVLQRCMVKP